MPYNPNLHHRRSIRLKGYNYTQPGLYFITICVQDRKRLFGKINNGVMVLSEFGNIAHQRWEQLSEGFTNMELDAFQIMPDHMHAIISLTVESTVESTVETTVQSTVQSTVETTVGATLAVAPNDDSMTKDNTVATNDYSIADIIREGAGASPAPTTTINTKTVGDIIGAYKSLVANDCLAIFKQHHPGDRMGKLWQHNYYEHIIRDERSYQRISAYIIDNPKKWKGK